MSKVEQIEAEIAQLPSDAVWELDDWFAEHKARLWDEQITRDAQPGGRLRPLIEKAKADLRAGRTRPLP